MKYLILTVLLLIVQAGSPVPRQGPTNLASNSSRNPQQSQKDKENPSSPAAIQDKEHPESTKRDGDNETTKREQEHVIVERLPGKDQWDKAYIIFTGVLVLVGLLTFGTVIYQALQTKRATVAMERSTNLQKAALRQWVNIQGFRDAVEPHYFTDKVPQIELHLSFEIANPTKMPLMLEWYVISINGTKYSSRVGVALAPDQVYGFEARMTYTDEIRAKYIRDGYDITVTGVIAYTDALKEFQKQGFGCIYKCGPTNGETVHYEGPLPDEDIEKEESKT